MELININNVDKTDASEIQLASAFKTQTHQVLPQKTPPRISACGSALFPRRSRSFIIKPSKLFKGELGTKIIQKGIKDKVDNREHKETRQGIRGVEVK